MANQVDNLAVAGGERRVEYAVRSDGETMLAKAFLGTLPQKTQTDILAKFAHLAQSGETRISPAMFCHERGDIWTFKHKLKKQRIRFPCFRENRWVITHGFIKPPQSKWPEQEFTLAETVKLEVEQRDENLKRQHNQGVQRHGNNHEASI